MVAFSNRDDIERWLTDKPREVAVVIAVRAALRAAPLLGAALRPREKVAAAGRSILLSVFRGMAAPWVAAAYPTNGAEIDFSSAAYAAADAADADAVASAVYAAAAAAADAATDAANAANAAVAASAAVASAVDADTAFIYEAVSADATELGGERFGPRGTLRAADLAIQPLWPIRPPSWAAEYWTRLKSALLAENKDWWVWTDWYEARLAGGPIDHDLELARVMIATDIWEGGPRKVNAEIARLIAQMPQPQADQSWHFFLSYGTQDETYARWIRTLLNNASYRVFAQFSDMPAGSNFVREMQQGLDRSERVIALLSPDYEKSDHCQAEWAAAYNSDPAGKARKLVPLLIRPADLNTLAKQIVYRQLIGLSPHDAAQAILDAIGHAGPFPSVPPGWPGSAVVDQVKTTTGGAFDVGPGADGLLERKPIPANPVNETGLPPEQLFADAVRQFDDFFAYTKKDKRNYICSDRLKDRAASLHQTAAAGFSQCDPLALNRNLVWVLQTITLDMKDGVIPRNDEMDFYVRDLYGQYNLLVSIFPQLKLYREVVASRKFVVPTAVDDQAIHDIYRAFGTYDIAKDALSAQLSDELKQAGEGIEKAKELAETSPSDPAKAVAVESHTEAATKGLGVWGWLANARDKLDQGGKKSAEVEKTIEGYEKLYKRVSPQMSVYIDYLLKWFF